jgi:hypothetical protein
MAAMGCSLLAGACREGSAGARGYVTVEPIETSTPLAQAPIGGKPATPPATATPGQAAEPTIDPPTATPEPPPAEPAPAEPASTPSPVPLASDGSSAPAEGRWIDVDVTRFVVRLMDGATVLREFGPVGVGEQVDTGDYASTQTGLFAVHTKIEELAYDPPYDTYISHWVGFDAEKANGFHSFLKDETGAVVDASTGRVSNGCIRTGAAEEIYAFAELGMPVWVHH